MYTQPVLQPFLALVDYYNQAQLPRHRDAQHHEHLQCLETIVENVANASLKICGIAEIRIRLYGGWFTGGQEEQSTDRSSLGAIARRGYPRRFGKSRVFVEIADALLTETQEPLTHTVRERPTIEPFRLRWPQRACVTTAGPCALADLDCWRRGRCPKHKECGVEAKDVATSRRQKLVDSMLVADTIEGGLAGGWVAAVPNDDDLIPGVLTAAAHTKKVALLRFGRERPSPYDSILVSRSLLPLE